MVSEGKLVVYRTEVVIPRGSGKVVNGERVPLSADGLEGYVKAIVDLYSTQRTLDGVLAATQWSDTTSNTNARKISQR
jgi:hypothetical protein